MALDPKEAALALHRFGFGPRPGGIAAIAADPRGALLAELERPDAGLIVSAGLPSSAAANRAVFEHVLGVSLGAPATMRFRRRRQGGFDRASALLGPRSIYHLTGEARHEWEHSIAAMAVRRWSVTFRSLSKKGL